LQDAGARILWVGLCADVAGAFEFSRKSAHRLRGAGIRKSRVASRSIKLSLMQIRLPLVSSVSLEILV
jgi:hypothetical protein